MTQMTEEQKQQFQAPAERVTDKLRAFHADLPADEQAVLDAVLRHAIAPDGNAGDDTAGYMYSLNNILYGRMTREDREWAEPPKPGGQPVDWNKALFGFVPSGSPRPPA